MDHSIYYYAFKVSSKDCTKSKKIKLPNLLDQMQEAAWSNATALGFSTIDLMQNNITWVMNRMQIEFHRLPHHREDVKVETWPAAMDKYITKRDFRVWDGQENLLVEATSNWLVMDIDSRKLIAIPDYIREAGFVVDRDNIASIEGKVKFDSDKTTHQKNIEVSWFDIDLNDHVNNIKYYQWILDSLPHDVLDQKRLKKIDITFRQEGKLGDHFVSNSYFEESEQCWLHCLQHGATKNVHIVAKSWFE